MGFKPKTSVNRVPEPEVEEEFEEPVQVPKVLRKPTPVQEVEEDLWSVQEVPTATQPVIYNARTQKVYTLFEAVAEILNRSE